MHKQFIQAFLMFLAVSASPNLYAEDLERLRAIMDPIETLTGDFQQTITEKSGDTVQQSSGSFSLKRPGYFFWESAEPFAQTIVGTPDTLWVYDPDLEQVTERRQTLNDNTSPVSILTGDPAALKTRFEVELQEQGAQQSFTLTPKLKGEANYDHVVVVFEQQQLASIRFIDKLQQTTTVMLSNVKRNSPVEPGRFEFVPPAGTDIVRVEQ